MTREISRQAFVLGALGVTAAGILAACGHPPMRKLTKSTASQSISGPPDWRALAGSVEGSVTVASDAGYPAASRLFNSRFDESMPAAVVAVASDDDVERAVAFAAEHDLEITTRSGGHSYVGGSAADGAMVIDVRGLRGGVAYDDGSKLATVSATDLLSVQTALAPHGRLIPAGSCPTVGVAGLVLGGGLGADSRRCGLTCDAMVSAVVVLPSGERVTAAADDHDDPVGAGPRHVTRTGPCDRDAVELG